VTKRHFIMLARNIGMARQTAANADQVRAIDTLACALAYDLKAENPRFDRDRFLTACGVVE
jgi:hypothetical protein